MPDLDRGQAFYTELFGWEFAPGPTATGMEVKTPGTPAGMHGGDTAARLYVFFGVDDLDAAIARVVQLGGEIQDVDLDGDAAAVAKLGRFKLCRDDQGAQFGLHQPPS